MRIFLLPTRWQASLGIPLIAAALSTCGDSTSPSMSEGSTTQELWRHDMGAEPTRPFVSGGVVYVSAGNYMRALDAATGEQLWRHGKIYDSHSPPTLSNQRVYVGTHGSGDNYVYALDVATGEVRWRTPTDSPVEYAPIVFEGVVYIGSLVGQVHALDVDTGELRWQYEITGLVWSFSLSDGVVYVESSREKGIMHALDAATGELLDDSAPYEDTGEIAVYEDLIYSSDPEGNLLALDADTGEIRWEFKKEMSARKPVVSVGVVYIGAFDGNLYALDAKTGELLRRYQVGSYVGSFTLSEGVAYVSSGDGYLYAFQLVAESAAN